MSALAVIGGSGLTALDGLHITHTNSCTTPYGAPSGELTFGVYAGQEIIFLPRHGVPHAIPPHQVNYRANIWSLREIGVDKIISVNAVGGISAEMSPGRLVIPEQIIDYTYGRAHTFFAEDLQQVRHIDFTEPYSAGLRQLLIRCAGQNSLDACPQGTYGATQGPRLETAAEITRMARDGCDIVGMTGMPEAALARELQLEYASISIVANWAAGRTTETITMEIIEENMSRALTKVHALLQAVIVEI